MYELVRLVSLTRQLIRMGRSSAEKILAVQEQGLRQLLSHAFEQSPFYRQRLRGLDLARCALSDLPPVTKAELMAHFDDWVTDRRLRRSDLEEFLADSANLGQYYLDQYAVSHTSGSQGQPALLVQDRQAVLLAFAAEFARGHTLPKRWTTWVRRVWWPARMAVVTQRPGFYPSGATFGYLPRAAQYFLKVLCLSVFDRIAENVAHLNEFRPEFLTGYTSSLEALAREEQAGRLRLRENGCLRQIVNISEPLVPASREWIETVFGVHIADHYAMGECLALSTGCPCYPGAHLNTDLAILEVVDDAYRSVPDGVPGSKVLVTNLYNLVQPFIRYEIGDVVIMSPTRCPCGSPLPLIQSIEGRTKDRLWIALDGQYRELPYYIFLAALHHYLEMAEHQVVQTGPNHFLLRAVPLPGQVLSPERLRRLVLQSVRAEGLDGVIELDIEIAAAIPPDRCSGKVKRVLNAFGPPPGGFDPWSRPPGVPPVRAAG
jgi:phenylacetate-coenzyme A ligase PaaK-like adenylate-forming protein